jgi:hypothetical protein
VRQAIARDHFLDVSASSRSEICIPFKRLEPFANAFAIDGVEEIFFVGAWRLPRKGFQGKNQKCERQKDWPKTFRVFRGHS